MIVGGTGSEASEQSSDSEKITCEEPSKTSPRSCSMKTAKSTTSNRSKASKMSESDSQKVAAKSANLACHKTGSGKRSGTCSSKSEQTQTSISKKARKSKQTFNNKSNKASENNMLSKAESTGGNFNVNEATPGSATPAQKPEMMEPVDRNKAEIQGNSLQSPQRSEGKQEKAKISEATAKSNAIRNRTPTPTPSRSGSKSRTRNFEETTEFTDSTKPPCMLHVLLSLLLCSV